MTEPVDDPTRPQTDRVISDLARGKAERVVLGNNPYGSILRIAAIVLLFVLVFGTLFFIAGR